MNENKSNYVLRVRSKNVTDDLDMLLVTVIALTAFVPFVLSGALIVTVFAALMLIHRTRKAVFAQKELFLLTCAISVLSLVSSLISLNFIGVLISVGVFVLLTVGAYLKEVMNRHLFERAALVVAIGSIPTAVVTVVQQILVEYEEYRPSAHAFNPNYLGAIAALSGVIMLVELFEKCDQDTPKRTVLVKKSLYAAALLSSGVTVLVTESRSSLLALTACAAAYVFLKKHYVIFGVAAALGAGIWVVGWFKPELFSWSNSLIEVFTVRYEIWKDAFRSFSQNAYTILIGRGPMSYFHVYEAEGLGAHHHAHNLVMDTLINVGVVGAVIYALIILVFVKKAFSDRKNGDTKAFILTALAVVEVFVQGIPDVTIMWHQTAVLFLIACASTFKTKSKI